MIICECVLFSGGGVRTHSRTCTNPFPKFGGQQCKGIDTEYEPCNTQICAIHGGYTDWGQWGSCTAKCGKTYQHIQLESHFYSCDHCIYMV
jgi:hypothetical protein